MGSSPRCKGDEVYIIHNHFLCVFFFNDAALVLVRSEGCRIGLPVLDYHNLLRSVALITS